MEGFVYDKYYLEGLVMEAAVKSTINISMQLKNELNSYVDKGTILTFSSGVNAAIKLYLKELRRREYDAAMAEAGTNNDFLARTLDCQNEMDTYDNGVSGEW